MLNIIDLISVIVAALSSLLAFLLIKTKIVQKLIQPKDKKPEKSYSERLAAQIESLRQASQKVDSVLTEFEQVARKRSEAVQKIEATLQVLESKEKDIRDRIYTLENTPLPVADYFATLLNKMEQRNKKRDYMLFGAGVITTTVFAMIIQIFIL